jgi:hypothetical protein
MMKSEEVVERMKLEIVADVENGIVPATVADFSSLHEFVDANCYGGASELFGEIVTESSTDEEHQAKLDKLGAIVNPAIDIVDAWIKHGGIAKATASPDTIQPVRVTVYRPKTMIGLGAPEAFLGDDHPTKGNWHQSAKADLPAGDQPPRLLLLGRAFLIYSMYHARDPYYLGLAVENFGAACEKLGYTLPLRSRDASWLTYGPEGLDRGDPEEYQFLFGQIATVFGNDAASDQADALGVIWRSGVGPNQQGPITRGR